MSETGSNDTQSKAGPRLILASGSARRRALLTQIGYPPDEIHPADIDETPREDELPRLLAGRLAEEKAMVVADRYPGDVVVSGDTVVAAGRRILPKAETRDEAATCLSLLSGRSHRVYTGMACAGANREKIRTRIVETRVKVKTLSHTEIDLYLDSHQWSGKAGGYAIQGAFAAFIIQIVGSYSGVVGLPLYETANLLRDALGRAPAFPAD
ncbi:maf protein [Parvularcula bermudensis HTCC2503]|uniref:dTTP/UTP pyrophosphatase n=1 Tax=Parvularcula bermudensis (strain ATCC BAA-594 / HTCC2503 / KCTC 12087) TaxID=314260 RepID=E0TBY2_PARBH|nr:Maf family nucleotide pyrophosphatase [Parvularcula bermudensis]ADM08475.1 maf protein [Parvularcula bermudensis HTCC2503]